MKLNQWIAGWFGYRLVRIERDDRTLDAHLVTLFAALRINCVIDVGANRGQYGEMLRRTGFRGRIVSFEPVSANFDELRRRASHGGDWRVHHCGLAAEPGLLTIHVSRASELSSFRMPSDFFHELFAATGTVERTEQAEVRRLDDCFAEIIEGIETPHVYLKVDTQGYDLEVLAGASQSLPRIIGLQSELSVVPLYDGSPDYVSSFAALRGLGFEPTGFYPVCRQSNGVGLVEFDCVMQRASPGA